MGSEQSENPIIIDLSFNDSDEDRSKTAEGADPMHPDFYSNHGYIYNYERFPKFPEHLQEYFSIPIVKKFLSQMKRGPHLFKRLTAGRFGNPELSEHELKKKVLDLGSGIGAESDALRTALPDNQIISLDISDTGTRHGKDVFDLNQVQADINAPPFPNNTFTGIHCKDVFVHVSDKEKFFANVARMLTMGGSFLLVSADEAYEEIDQFEWQLKETIEIAAKYGLKLVKKDKRIFKIDDWYESGQTRMYLLFKKVK